MTRSMPVIAGVAATASMRRISRRAKTRLVADAVYAQDNQATLARWYGASLARGLGLEDVAQWPERIEAVTPDDVKKAALWLDKRRSVTGFLLAGGILPRLDRRGHDRLPPP